MEIKETRENFIARVMGLPHDPIKEVKREVKPLSKAAAITLLKYSERPTETIIVITRNTEKIGNEIRESLGKEQIKRAQFHNSDGMYQIDTVIGGKIALMSMEITDRICGYRAQVMIVEGDKESFSKEEIFYSVMPFMSISFDPWFVKSLEERCGESLKKFARQNELLFTDGEQIQPYN